MFRLPATRTEFWAKKIESNRTRDVRAIEALASAGWRRLIVWECALRGPVRLTLPDVLDVCEGFLTGEELSFEVSGRWSD